MTEKLTDKERHEQLDKAYEKWNLLDTMINNLYASMGYYYFNNLHELLRKDYEKIKECIKQSISISATIKKLENCEE